MNQKTLGSLEQRVMDIVWELKQCSVRDVLVRLNKRLAYTTIATILQRLYSKGLLIKKPAPYGFIYMPKVSKESYSKQVANSFLKKFIGSFGDTAIASFADSIDKLPEKKREYFLRLLDEYDNTK